MKPLELLCVMQTVSDREFRQVFPIKHMVMMVVRQRWLRRR